MHLNSLVSSVLLSRFAGHFWRIEETKPGERYCAVRTIVMD
jgi:hypothetical protein